MAYFGVIFFANMGGGGGQNYCRALDMFVVVDCRCGLSVPIVVIAKGCAEEVWWTCFFIDQKRRLLRKGNQRGNLSRHLMCWGGTLENVRNVPVTPAPSIFPKVLPYKWGAYCRTNGRRTAVQMGGVLQGFPFFEALKPGKYSDTNGGRTAVQMGGVLPYFLDKL